MFEDSSSAPPTYLNGISSLVELLLLQRQRDRSRGWRTAGFVSGYRGSPLAGLDQALQRASQSLSEADIRFSPGLNEELAATAVWGTQQIGLSPGAKNDGVFAMWYAKAPGVERSTDALRHANGAGTSPRGGVIALLGDDHSCKSSTLPSASELLCRHMAMPVLSPADVQDVLNYGLLGWEMSRFAGLWVGLKCLIDTMDASARVIVDPNRVVAKLPDDFIMPSGGLSIRWPDTPLDQEARLIDSKLAAALAFARANRIDRIIRRPAHARIGVIATGKSFLDVNQALELLGLEHSDEIALYKVGMPWPLEQEGLKAFARGLDTVVIVEEKAGLIEEQARALLYDLSETERPRIAGKLDEARQPLFPARYELEPSQIALKIGAQIQRIVEDPSLLKRLSAIEARTKAAGAPPVPKRTPYFCAGCPHSTSTRLPEGSRALAGIGCHYMAQWMDRSTSMFSQMGGEGAAWIGQADFTDEPHVFANLGDGTYAHSGALAIRAAIAAGVNITYKILFNDAVAMTGGQAVEGELTPVQIAMQLSADGVSQIAIVSDNPAPFKHAQLPSKVRVVHRRKLDVIQRRFRETKGVTAIIYDQSCATERRRRRKRGIEPEAPARVFIAEEICEGCGDCGEKSNCVAIKLVETELGRKRAIDQSTCNQDYSCIDGFCPSFVTVKGARPRRGLGNEPDIEGLPAPDIQDAASIVIAGMGGTGVVTLGAVLGLAADFDDKGVTVLDMIGMAQKGGQVLTHLRIAPRQADIRSYRIPAGTADLLIGCDSLAAASVESLSLVDCETARAILASDEIPTGDFTRDPDYAFPTKNVNAALSAVFQSERLESVDARRLAVTAVGDAIGANLLLLGVCAQRGLLPLTPAVIEEGIRRNGIGVELSINAFRWGRCYAHNPRCVLETLGLSSPPSVLAEFEPIVADRMDRLKAYQNEGYARRYEAVVRRVAQAERRVLDGQSISIAAARNLYKVMAYKDEYEVARIFAGERFKSSLESVFEGSFGLEFNLAPPILGLKDSDGRPRKSRFGPWMMHTFVLLAGLRGLRGTRFDPFGWTEERRAERALVRDYTQDLMEIASALTVHNADAAQALADVPQSIRGFGHIKEKSMSNARNLRARCLERFRARTAEERTARTVETIQA